VHTFCDKPKEVFVIHQILSDTEYNCWDNEEYKFSPDVVPTILDIYTLPIGQESAYEEK